MTKYFRWLSLLRRSAGRSRKERREGSNIGGKANVNREYMEAFRTKSYVEICNKGKLSPTSSSSLNTEYLVEPGQEIVTNMNVHPLLVDYFDATLEACRCCDTILQAIHKTRLAYATLITNVVKRNQPQNAIYSELSKFVSQNNPLSIISPVKFRDAHMLLLHRLMSKKGKIRRILTIKGVCKKVGGIGLVILQSAILVALLVFAFHSIIGLVAAPCLLGSLFGLIRKRFKHERVNTKCSRRLLCEQLDVAARGVYILVNDLDTMSRMVKRLDDEAEHWREVADICVKSCNGEILRQVVREFRDNESNFLDMLKELEEHIYLCFLNVNRSRKLVMQEITGNQC